MPPAYRADPGGMRVGTRGVDPLRRVHRPRDPEIARLVSEHERYAVVQTALAMAVPIARDTDPHR
jgi:hypothetical protein